MTEDSGATLAYCLICDDVRIEMGNKMSLMGIFQNILLPRFPATVVKFAVLSHWQGKGTFTSELRILGPSGTEGVRSHATTFTIASGGHADNVTFFTNVTFPEPGTYRIQVVLAGEVVREIPLRVQQVPQQSPPASGTVN